MNGPVIADSARKHGILDEDILHAWRNQIGAKYHGEGFTMAVGPSQSADLLEIGTVDADDGLVIVHAMQARPGTLEKCAGRTRKRNKETMKIEVMNDATDSGGDPRARRRPSGAV